MKWLKLGAPQVYTVSAHPARAVTGHDPEAWASETTPLKLERVCHSSGARPGGSPPARRALPFSCHGHLHFRACPNKRKCKPMRETAEHERRCLERGQRILRNSLSHVDNVGGAKLMGGSLSSGLSLAYLSSDSSLGLGRRPQSFGHGSRRSQVGALLALNFLLFGAR